ncbi:hypothetical protein [Corynebacterium sp. A21]|uniref:hypothetical protein n=1 Tax=Corynebacterium sp. A21 TaxID=3457318 RepID=UPI003FD26E6B
MSSAVYTSSSRRSGPRSAAGPVMLGIALISALFLAGCGTTVAADNEGSAGSESPDDQIRVPTQPIDAIALNNGATSPVSLATGPETVTFTWQGLMIGQPVAHDDCVGMLALTDPVGRLITLDPSLRSCAGSTELLIDAAHGSPAGDYRLQVMLNGLNNELILPVLP